MKKKALVCGISGQDGAYLARLLLEKGYQVFGTSRDAQFSSSENLTKLNIHEKVALDTMVLTDFRSVLQALSNVKPDEIYNLAGQSSVGLSFQQPVETLESIAMGAINLLESIRFLGFPTRLYNAGSSECFGDTLGEPADEETCFRPKSPYAVAKTTAHWAVVNYREAYDLFACNGILFNHESPLRSERFVTRKIVASACRIAAGKEKKLTLGNCSIQRDWGWAPEYVDAMWRMLQQPEADDFVIATGQTHSLKEFVAAVFSQLDLKWQEHVEMDNSLLRPSEIMVSRSNPAKAETKLGWKAKYDMYDAARMMVEAQLTGVLHA